MDGWAWTVLAVKERGTWHFAGGYGRMPRVPWPSYETGNDYRSPNPKPNLNQKVYFVNRSSPDS